MALCTVTTLRSNLVAAMQAADPEARVHAEDPFTSESYATMRDRLLVGEGVHVWYVQSISPLGAALPGAFDREAAVELRCLLNIGESGSFTQIELLTDKVLTQLEASPHARSVAVAGYAVQRVLDQFDCHRTTVSGIFFALSPA